MSRPSLIRGARGIMLAVDVESLDKARLVLDAVSDYVAALKVGNFLMYSHGDINEVVNALLAYRVPVVLDTKILDVHHIAEGSLKALADLGLSAVTIWSTCSERTIAACADLQDEMDVILLTGRTDEMPEEIIRDGDLALQLVTKYSFRSIQVPGNYPGRVARARQIVGPDVVIVSCGIGEQGGEAGSAITAGADYEIIGRSIVRASDPRAAAARCVAAIDRGIVG